MGAKGGSRPAAAAAHHRSRAWAFRAVLGGCYLAKGQVPIRSCDANAQALAREGLAWVDDGAPDGVRLYWFPCLGSAMEAA